MNKFQKQKISLVLSYRFPALSINPKSSPPGDDAGKEILDETSSKAMVMIGLSLSDKHLNDVTGLETAKEMWPAILYVFEKHTLLNRLTARWKLCSLTMKEGESVLSFTNRVNILGPLYGIQE